MKKTSMQPVFGSEYGSSGSDSSEKPRSGCWWSRRTRLEKWLIIAFVASLILTLVSNVIIIFLSVYNGQQTRSVLLRQSQEESQVISDGNKVCLTPGCVRAASRIIENMDAEISPCQDFYEFACGGWSKSKYIGDDQTGITEFGALREDLNRKLRALVERESNVQQEPIYVRDMKLMYKQCMNMSNIESYQARPLVKDIISVGGWPVVEGPNWNSSKFDWIDVLGKFRRRGFSHNVLFSYFVGPDVKNSSQHIVQIDQPTLGLPNRKYLLNGFNDSVVKAYFGMMVDTAIMLGAKDKERVETEMMEVLNFETQLANLSLPMEERRNFTELYHKMKLRQVMDIASNTDWLRLAGHVFVNPVDEDEDVVVKVPSYLQRADALIVETPERVLANYMVWRLVYSTFPQLGRRWRMLSDKYDKALTGKTKERPRWDTCMRRLYGSFGVPLSAMYVKEHFDEDSMHMAKEMVQYIRTEFIRMLKGVDWMDEDTKQMAIEKAQSITAHIGYSKEILVESKVMELFQGLELSANFTFYENVQQLRKYWSDQDMKKLREHYNKNDWKKFSQAATINAFYNSLENSIKFPAGILQGVFFDKSRPKYLNYGGIGYIIGHEITHGFDDRGRQFDKRGNNRNWWKPETDLKYQEKASCIVDQYNNFTVPESAELKLNGVNTQGENIADNGGLKEAFLGYQQYVKENGAEAKLPGLKYSPNQLFWISAANVWCAKLRPQALKLRIQTGVHSPPRFRVIGPMVNLPQFAETFDCPVGSPMNPINKCSLW
ncbi:Membrane metallo-endopeptidase-like 1 [Halotydeus destructor]|nr:Membrane metallo-endopeptidase-like 1 [Halotydeus destructor]